MKNVKLSIREQIFCNEYVKNNGDGINAVKSAGYECGKRNNAGSIAVQCSRLLKKKHVISEISRQQDFILKATSISKSEIVQAQYELYLLARSNEEYKTASNILESLTKLLGYTPRIEDKQIVHNVRFENLLDNAGTGTAKDITPKMPAITVN